MLHKLALFPSSGKQSNQFGPLERANLNFWMSGCEFGTMYLPLHVKTFMEMLTR
jgi:hypothetical protein